MHDMRGPTAASTVGMIIKPHALEGPDSTVGAAVALEFVVMLRKTLLELKEMKTLSVPSREAYHALPEVKKRILYESWHIVSLRHPRACQRRLLQLSDHYRDVPRRLNVEEVITDATYALGFTIKATNDYFIRREDYGLLYPEAPALKDHRDEMMSYIAGQCVRLMVAVGDEENVGLQLMKLCLRSVLQTIISEGTTIPRTKLPVLDVQNYLHVCDPDSGEIARIVKLCRYLQDSQPLSSGPV